jgi:FkbH-like protein
MRALIAPFDEEHLTRVAQLVGKTNQFNLTSRRHTIAELRSFMHREDYVTRYLILSDRLADHGLVSVLIGAVDDCAIDIDTLLMSCRVIGRTLEAQLLAHLSREALRLGCRALRGTYIPTPKNPIVADLYGQFGFLKIDEDQTGATRWEYDLAANGPIMNQFIEESPQP